MAKFEVFIPAVGEGGFDLTFRVEADNWLAALNTGLKKIGEKGGAGTGFLVDIQDDNSIHVTDPMSQRVFRITEQEEVTQTGPSAAKPAAPAEPAPNPFDPLPGRSTQIDLPAVQVPAPIANRYSDRATLPPTPGTDLYLKRSTVFASFATGLSDRDKAIVAATQRPATIAALNEPSGTPAWRTIPSWYLIGRKDAIIPAAAETAMAKRAGSVITEYDAGHLGLMSDATTVTSEIERAARAAVH